MLPVANPKVIFKALSDGAVLFSSEDEVYFGLNAVGAQVWALLPPVSGTFDELCAAIAAQYPDVDPQVIHDDVRELLAELASHHLVLPPPPGQSDEQSDEKVSSETGEAHSARVG